MDKKTVKEIKEASELLDLKDYIDFIEKIKDDNRKSVQNIIKSLLKKIEKEKNEDIRLETMCEYEMDSRKKGYIYIGGIDEAGRGPLAGPVVAAVAIFDSETKIRGVNDSKKLSEKKRNELFDEIKEKALDFGIGIVDNDTVDDINILNATYEAMKRAVNCLKIKPDILLMDAVIIKDLDIEQISLIKGDQKSISIAAASILAKVTRDEIMYQYDLQYPEYDFKSNKGYGTAKHYESIEKCGITPIHRKSFLKNINY